MKEQDTTNKLRFEHKVISMFSPQGPPDALKTTLLTLSYVQYIDSNGEFESNAALKQAGMLLAKEVGERVLTEKLKDAIYTETDQSRALLASLCRRGNYEKTPAGRARLTGVFGIVELEALLARLRSERGLNT